MIDENSLKRDFFDAFEIAAEQMHKEGLGAELKRCCAQLDERFRKAYFDNDKLLAPTPFSAIRDRVVTGKESDPFGLGTIHYNQIANVLKYKGVLKRLANANFKNLWSKPEFKRIRSLIREAQLIGDSPIDIKADIPSSEVEALLSELTSAELGTLDSSLRETLIKDADFARANRQYTENKILPFIEREGIYSDTNDPASMLMRTAYKKAYGRTAYLDKNFVFLNDSDFVNDIKSEYTRATNKHLKGESFEELREELVLASLEEERAIAERIAAARGNKEAVEAAKRYPTAVKNAINRIRYDLSEKIGRDKIVVTKKTIEDFNKYLVEKGIPPVSSHLDIKNMGLGGLFIDYLGMVTGIRGVYLFDTSPYDLFSNQDRANYKLPIQREDFKDTVKSFLFDCSNKINENEGVEKTIALNAIGRETYDIDLFGYVQKNVNIAKLVGKYRGLDYSNPDKVIEMTAKVREFLKEFDSRIIEQGWKYAAPGSSQNMIERLVSIASEIDSIVVPKLTEAEEKDPELGYGKKRAIEAIEADRKRLFEWFSDALYILEETSNKVVRAAKSDLVTFDDKASPLAVKYLDDVCNGLRDIGAVDALVKRYRKENALNMLNDKVISAVKEETQRYKDMGYSDAVNYLSQEEALEAKAQRDAAVKLDAMGGGKMLEEEMLKALQGVTELESDITNIHKLSALLKKANAEGKNSLTNQEITELIRHYNNMVEINNRKNGVDPDTDKISLFNDAPLLNPFGKESAKSVDSWRSREQDIEKMERFYVGHLLHYKVISEDIHKRYEPISNLADKLLIDVKEEGLFELCDTDEEGNPVSTKLGADEILKYFYDKENEITDSLMEYGDLSAKLNIIEANKNAIIEVTKFNDLKNRVTDDTKQFILDNSERILQNKNNGLPLFEGIDIPSNMLFTQEELVKIVEQTSKVEIEEGVIHDAVALRRRIGALSRTTLINSDGETLNINERDGIDRVPSGFDGDDTLAINRFATSYVSNDEESDEEEIEARVSAKLTPFTSAEEADDIRENATRSYNDEKREALKVVEDCDKMMNAVRNSDNEEAKELLTEIENDVKEEGGVKASFEELKRALALKHGVQIEDNVVDLSKYTDSTAKDIVKYAKQLGIMGAIGEDGKLSLSSESIEKDYSRRYFVSAVENKHDNGLFVEAITDARNTTKKDVDLEEGKVSKAVDDIFNQAVRENYANDGHRFNAFFESADGKNSEREYAGLFKEGEGIENKLKNMNLDSLEEVQRLRKKYSDIRASQEPDYNKLQELISETMHADTLKKSTLSQIKAFTDTFSTDEVKSMVSSVDNLTSKEDFKNTVHGNINHEIFDRVHTAKDLNEHLRKNPYHGFAGFSPFGEGMIHDEYVKKIMREARKVRDFWDMKRTKKFAKEIAKIGDWFSIHHKYNEKYGINSALDCFSVSRQMFTLIKALGAVWGAAALAIYIPIRATAAVSGGVGLASAGIGAASDILGGIGAQRAMAAYYRGKDFLEQQADALAHPERHAEKSEAMDKAVRATKNWSDKAVKSIAAAPAILNQEKFVQKEIDTMQEMVREMFPNQMFLRGDKSKAALLSDDLNTASVFKDRIEKIVDKIDNRIQHIYDTMDVSSQDPEMLRALAKNYLKLSAVGKTFASYLSTDVHLTPAEIANIEGNIFNMLKTADLKEVLVEASSSGLKNDTISLDHQMNMQKHLENTPDLATLVNMEETLFDKILDPRTTMDKIEANKKGEEMMIGYLKKLKTEGLNDTIKPNGTPDYKKVIEALGAYSAAMDKISDEVVLKQSAQISEYKRLNAPLQSTDPKKKANELAITHLQELIDREDKHRWARNRRLELATSFVVANAKARNIDIDADILQDTVLPTTTANKMRRIIEARKKGMHYTDMERYYNGVDM